MNPYQLVTRIPNGGFNRAAKPHALGSQDFYDLLSLRPFIGSLEQTAGFEQYQTLSLLTGEAATSHVHFLALARTAANAIRYLVLNETNARYIDPTSLSTQTLIPCVLQTAIPNNTTVNGQVLLYGINSTDFAASGDTIDVNINTDSTHFRWRRNGGSWSSDTVIADGVAIGANGLKLGFLTTTGFTVGDTWTWTRSNTIPWDSSTGLYNQVNSNYNLDSYFGGVGRTILRVRNGFITSVGYKRVYGRYVAVFQNHLVVAHFGEGTYSGGSPADPYDATTTPFKLGWSDLNNPDCFFAMDVNEADTYSVPYGTSPDNINLGITGLAPLRDNLVIYLPDSIHEMNYVGLPNVMQISQKYSGIGSYFPTGLVQTKRGHYFLSRDNIYLYDGTPPVPIGEPVREKLFSEMVGPADTYRNRLWGYYDANRQEVIWTYWTLVGSYYQERQVVFQERYNRWFFRNVPSVDIQATGGNVYAACQKYSSITEFIYGGKFLYADMVEGSSSTPLKDTIDSGGTTSFVQPTVTTNDFIYNQLFYVKEAGSFYLDASWSAQAASMSGIELAYQFRSLVATTVSLTAASGYWTPSIEQRRLSFPRTSGAVARFKMTFVGTTPLDCKLYAFGDFISNKNAEVIR